MIKEEKWWRASDRGLKRRLNLPRGDSDERADLGINFRFEFYHCQRGNFYDRGVLKQANGAAAVKRFMGSIFTAIRSTDEVHSEGLGEPCILLKANWCLSILAALPGLSCTYNEFQ